MPAITNPILTLRIKLPRRMHLRCVVWDNVATLRANTPEVSKKDYAAVFIPTFDGSCIGTIHLALTDLKNGRRAHEISHALDEWESRLTSEPRAQATERVTNELDVALRDAGLI